MSDEQEEAPLLMVDRFGRVVTTAGITIGSAFDSASRAANWRREIKQIEIHKSMMEKCRQTVVTVAAFFVSIAASIVIVSCSV